MLPIWFELPIHLYLDEYFGLFPSNMLYFCLSCVDLHAHH